MAEGTEVHAHARRRLGVRVGRRRGARRGARRGRRERERGANCRYVDVRSDLGVIVKLKRARRVAHRAQGTRRAQRGRV